MKKEVDKSNSSGSPAGPTVSYHSFSAESTPEIIENSNGKWIDYGVDNLYPQLLIEKYRKSAVHNALVTGISLFIAGEGILGLEDPEKVNSQGDDFHEVFSKCAFDIKLHGYYTLQVIYSIDGSRIVERIHVPAEKVRSGPADQHGKVHNFYIHPDWVDTHKNKPKQIAAFDPKDGAKDKRQLQMVKLPSAPGQFFYRTPDYIGAMNYISLDDSIGEFHLDNIQTGFFPSAIIQFFNGEPTEDNQRDIERSFSNKFAGARGKKLVFVYNKNKNQAVQFDTFEPADLDERFKNLGPQVTEKIMVAHRVTTPMLFGVKTESGLGNNADEMKIGLLIMNKLVIVPFQKTMLRGFKKTFINDEAAKVLEVKTLQPEEFLTVGNDGGTSSEVEAAPPIPTQINSQMSDQRDSMPAEIELTDEMVAPVLKELAKVGQKESDMEKDFERIEVPEDVADEDVEEYLKKKYNFIHQFAIESDPASRSRLDKGLFKIRYKYKGPRDSRNRIFCSDVLSMDLIYRKEDIDKMSFTTTNPQFGTYSIFKFKGSFGCRHKWDRLIYFRKRSAGGQFLTNDGLKNDKIVKDTGEAVIPSNKAQSDATSVNPKPKK